MILRVFIFLSFIFLLSTKVVATEQQVRVKPNGVTQIAATLGKSGLQISIKTHEVNIGKPSDPRPAEIYTSCTYSRHPCSVVDSIQIKVDGNPIFIPRSVFADLADLNTAEIKVDQQEAMLFLLGGDASESFMVKITFDVERIKSRSMSGSISPAEPLQETTYHTVTVGD